MYERFIPESESILMEFCKVEGCEPDKVRADSGTQEIVQLREKFSAFAYMKGLTPLEISQQTSRGRANIYHAMRKDSWRENIRRYEQL